MPRRTRVALGALVLAVAMVALSATVAFAAPSYTVNLTPSNTGLRYGQEFTLQPSVVGTNTLAFSVVALEKSWDGVNWTTDGFEGLKTDGDTGTVDPIDPQYMIVDDTLLPTGFSASLPTTVYFRAIFKPSNALGALLPASENQTSAPTAVTFFRNTKVTASVSAPRYASRKRSFVISAGMSRNSGFGLMRVTISKKGYSRSYLVSTDEVGTGDFRVKLSKGTYKVQSRWLGNVWGARSAWSKVKKVTVR
jgi:hypothetical protein